MVETVKDKTVKLNGLNFHYRDWGGSGLALVLLHGLASTSRIWDLVAPKLSKRFRVLALDQRGHGESDKPEAGYDFKTIVGDLKSFLEALAVANPVVVGHSWGASVALEYAALHPENTAALVLVDGGFLEMQSRPGLTWEWAERELAPPDLSGMTVEALKERAKSWALGAFWNEAVEGAVLANFEVQPDNTIRPRLSRANHMNILRSLWEQQSSELFVKVRCPVLMVPAARDGASEREALFLAHKKEAIAKAEQVLPQAETLWMVDTVHDIPLQRPKELADAIVRFVSGRVPAAPQTKSARVSFRRLWFRPTAPVGAARVRRRAR